MEYSSPKKNQCVFAAVLVMTFLLSQSGLWAADMEASQNSLTLQPAVEVSKQTQGKEAPQAAAQSSIQFLMNQSPFKNAGWGRALPAEKENKKASQKIQLEDGSFWQISFVGESSEIAEAKLYKDSVNLATVQRKGEKEYRLIDHRNGLTYENVRLASTADLTELFKNSDSFAGEFKKYYTRMLVYVSGKFRISLAEAANRMAWKTVDLVSNPQDLLKGGARDFNFEYINPDGKRDYFQVHRPGDSDRGDFFGTAPDGTKIDLKSPLRFERPGGGYEEHYFDSDGKYLAFAVIRPNGSKKVYDAVTRRLVGETINGKMVLYVGYAGKGFWRLEDAIAFAGDGDTIQISSSARYIKGTFATDKKIKIKGGNCQLSGDSWVCGKP